MLIVKIRRPGALEGVPSASPTMEPNRMYGSFWQIALERRNAAVVKPLETRMMGSEIGWPRTRRWALRTMTPRAIIDGAAEYAPRREIQAGGNVKSPRGGSIANWKEYGPRTLLGKADFRRTGKFVNPVAGDIVGGLKPDNSAGPAGKRFERICAPRSRRCNRRRRSRSKDFETTYWAPTPRCWTGTPADADRCGVENGSLRRNS